MDSGRTPSTCRVEISIHINGAGFQCMWRIRVFIKPLEHLDGGMYGIGYTCEKRWSCRVALRPPRWPSCVDRESKGPKRSDITRFEISAKPFVDPLKRIVSFVTIH